MRKLKEVLRLRYELGLGQRQIARSCSIGHGTVYEYLKRAQAAGVTWPLPEGWDDRQLEAALFGRNPAARLRNPQAPAGFCPTPRRTPTPSSPDAAVGLGGVSAGPPGRLRLQPLLRTLPTVAAAAGCGAAPGSCRRERSSSSITPGRRSPSMTRRAGRSGRPRSSSPSWGPATTLMPKPPRARS